MRTSGASHPDLLADALRGPSPEDAASSLAYWRARLERLPARRVAARREARAMVQSWEERLRRAEFERVGGGPVGRALAWIAVLRGERPGAIARRAVYAVVPRRLITGFLAIVVVGAIAFGVTLGVTIAGLV